ncbi:substrate-binding periplasmic protein [Shewanella pneumatophori]|uniref:Transporter substrate-binding domain-containing protein n=1 Tax=Shewanella pneumatophori TaxID=314092 RepID=A0A9X1ZDS7_9GAMM|nr:transporter substrate-binding domain-containing protein [Shewanella pneumatophori]MCL1140399.1 transporter substrate-binding domain-containing protein [Shewanella pneumatophori]
MKFINAVFTAAILLFGYSPFHSKACELTYLVIANQAEPFQINTSNHQSHSGIISDVVSLLAAKKPFSYTTHVMPFKRYVHEIKKQTYSNWISYGSPMWRTTADNRYQNKRLSKQPLFRASHLLVQRNSDPQHYQQVEDLFGKTVILLKGFDYPGLAPYIASGQIKKIGFKSHQSALNALNNQRGDLFVEMESRIRYAIKQHNIDPNTFKFTDIAHITPSLNIHLAFGNGVKQTTVDWIDDQIIIMKATGKLEAIINRYQ